MTKGAGTTGKHAFFGALPVVFVTTYWPDLSLFLPRLILPKVMAGIR